MMQPTILHKPAMAFAGYEAAFIHALSPDANNTKIIGPLWSKLCHQLEQIPNRVDDATYGLIYGRPADRRHHKDELQYIAGVCVNDTTEILEGMSTFEIPATQFAVFTLAGPLSGLAGNLKQIYREWLPHSEWRHSQIADVERYDSRFHPDRDDSVMEYWISIASV